MSAAEVNMRHIARVKRDLSADVCSIIDTIFSLFGKKQETVNPATLDTIVKYAKIVLGFAQQIFGAKTSAAQSTEEGAAVANTQVQEILQKYVKCLYPKHAKSPSKRVIELITHRSRSIDAVGESVESIAIELINLFGNVTKCRITSSKILSLLEKVCDDALSFFMADNTTTKYDVQDALPQEALPQDSVTQDVSTQDQVSVQDGSPEAPEESQKDVEEEYDENESQSCEQPPPLPCVPPPSLPPQAQTDSAVQDSSVDPSADQGNSSTSQDSSVAPSAVQGNATSQDSSVAPSAVQGNATPQDSSVAPSADQCNATPQDSSVAPQDNSSTSQDALAALDAVSSDPTLGYLSSLIPALQDRIRSSQTVILLLN